MSAPPITRRPTPLGAVVQQAPRWRGTRRLARDRAAVLGVILVTVMCLAVAAAPLLTSVGPNDVNPVIRFEGPSREHLMGTDQLGRDIFTRILYGGRLSIGLALAATFGTTAIGLSLGLLSAVRGGLVDAVVMRVVDTLQALPGLLLALALVGILGPSLRNLVIAIVSVWWAGYARLVRGMALSVRERPYVESARAVGASELRILVRYVLPNLLGPIVVMSTLDLGRTLLAVAGLSFLGLGARPPTPEWGAMLAEAKSYLDRAPMLLGYPGLAITVFGLSCNLIGDGVRDALDPRFERRGTR